MVSENDLMFVNVFKEGILVFLTGQFAASSEVPCFDYAAQYLAGHCFSIAASACTPDLRSFIYTILFIEGIADLTCPAVFLIHICTFRKWKSCSKIISYAVAMQASDCLCQPKSMRIVVLSHLMYPPYAASFGLSNWA